MKTRIDMIYTKAMELMMTAIPRLKDFSSNDSAAAEDLNKLCLQTEQAIHAAAMALSSDETSFPSNPNVTLGQHYFQAARFYLAYIPFLANRHTNPDRTLSHLFALAYEDSIIPGMHRGHRKWLLSSLASALALAPTVADAKDETAYTESNCSALMMRALQLVLDLDRKLGNQTAARRPEPELLYQGDYDAPIVDKKAEHPLDAEQPFDEAQFKLIMNTLRAEHEVVKRNLAAERRKDQVLSGPAIKVLSTTAAALTGIKTDEIKAIMRRGSLQKQSLPAALARTNQPVPDPEPAPIYFKYEWDGRVDLLKKQNCLGIINKVVAILYPDDQKKQSELFHPLAKNYEMFLTLAEKEQFRRYQLTDPALIADYLKNLAAKTDDKIKSSLAKKIGKDNVEFFVAKILPFLPRPIAVAEPLAPAAASDSSQHSMDTTGPKESKSAPKKPRTKPKSELEKLLSNHSQEEINNIASAFGTKGRSPAMFGPHKQTSAETHSGKGEKRKISDDAGPAAKKAKLA